MRKQLLLGTTALIVGALAAPDFAAGEEPLRLSVRGYKNEYFGLGDVDDDSQASKLGAGGPKGPTDFGSTAHFSDGEIHFKGSTDLDNGITVGVDVQLEASDNGDQIDEAYTWLSGDFGKLVIGSENLPDYLVFWGVTAPNVGVPINSGWISIWAPAPTLVPTGFRNSIQTTNVTLANDVFQIGYQSSRFSGFQFVAGYAPTNSGDGSTTSLNPPRGLNSGDPKNGVTDENNEIHNIFSVGANFKESFNGVDVGVAAGYEHGEQADLSPLDDPQVFKVGASLGVGGFSVAGSYALNDVDTGQEGQAYDVGVSYATGPWGVSGTYFHGEQEDTAGGGDDEVDAFVAAVSYSVGPGITASGSVFYANWEDEAGVQESESIMGIIGLSIGF